MSTESPELPGIPEPSEPTDQPPVSVIRLTFNQYLAQDRVKRWHVVEVGREQRLMEHAGAVAIIADEILRSIRKNLYDPIDRGPWNIFVAQVLRLALYHDAHEVVMGDRPTCAKDYGDTAKRISDRVQETLYECSWPLLAESIIDTADSLEALRFLLRNPVGSHSKEVAAEIHKRVNEEIGSLWFIAHRSFALNENQFQEDLNRIHWLIGEDL